MSGRPFPSLPPYVPPSFPTSRTEASSAARGAKGMSQNRPEEEEQKGKESRVEPTWARSDWRRGRGRTPQCVMSGKEKGEFPFLPPFSGRGRKEKQKRGQGLLLCRDWGPAAELKINQKLFFSLDFPFSFLDRPLCANVVFRRVQTFAGEEGENCKTFFFPP